MDERHFFNPHFIIRTPVKKHIPLPDKVYDKLFYTIYHKLNEDIYSFEKYNEPLEKIKVVEALETLKFKHKKEVLEDLLKENIPIHCLDALCIIWRINIIWYCDYFFYESMVDSTAKVYYLSNLYEWGSSSNIENKTQLVDLFKPLKSISYYTLAELKDMCKLMKHDSKTKHEHYSEIQNYFKHVKLI